MRAVNASIHYNTANGDDVVYEEGSAFDHDCYEFLDDEQLFEPLFCYVFVSKLFYLTCLCLALWRWTPALSLLLFKKATRCCLDTRK